jgi:uncharacterized protein (TIGR02996 family)
VTDEQTFLRAILDDPAEDTHRLVYADWLDDHATPRRRARAALIRTQVELARTPKTVTVRRPADVAMRQSFLSDEGGFSDLRYEPYVVTTEEPNPRHVELTARVDPLLKKWGNAWITPEGRKHARHLRRVENGMIAVGDFLTGLAYRFRRGFIEEAGLEVVGPPAEFAGYLPHFASLLKAHPVGIVRFSIEGHAPTVMLRVGRDASGGWALDAKAGDEEGGEEVFDLTSAVYESRRELEVFGPGLCVRALGETDFERITDHGDDYADLDLPDHYDQGFEYPDVL